jgi:hypothetical protein
MISTLFMPGTSIQLPSDYFPKLSIFWLNQWDYLKKNTIGLYKHQQMEITVDTFVEDFHPYIMVTTAYEKTRSEPQKISLTRTPCYFGGWRYWLQCPRHRNGLICGGRHGALYAYKGYFACRACHDMTYSSRQHNSKSLFQQYVRAKKSERKLLSLGFDRRRLWYGGKPTQYSREIHKLHRILLVDD